ncbi:MAG: ATP-binding cassette domain-containing protein, partial [Candidatus Aenigmatarchaeota archaeon]
SHDIRKEFKNLVAVDNLNIEVEEGEIFGLLGPNGAGKTTLISMLCTILKPTSGTATINGYDIIEQENDVRKSIGIVFQEQSLDDKLTGEENLEMHAVLYKVPKDARMKRIDDVLALVELKDRANDLVKTYSGGMRRRLEIARSLIHYPKVLFLDEPTLGLDPQTREHVWNYITELAKREKITVVLTTHYLEEADSLCGRIAIIDHGKIVACDTPMNLKNSLGGDSIIIKTPDAELAQKTFYDSKVFDGSIVLSVENAEKGMAAVIDKARKNNIEITEISMRKPSLNEVFLRLTGREIREESVNSKDIMKQKFGDHG